MIDMCYNNYVTFNDISFYAYNIYVYVIYYPLSVVCSMFFFNFFFFNINIISLPGLPAQPAGPAGPACRTQQPDFTKFHIFVLVSIFYLPYIICSCVAVSLCLCYYPIFVLCLTRVK